MGPIKSDSGGLIAKLAPESTMSGNYEGIESKGYKSTCPKVG